MTVNRFCFALSLSLSCYVTTSKSVACKVCDVIARIAKMLQKNVILKNKKRQRKKKVLVGWWSDKTFMIT